jgi:hypothetical protein
MMIFVAARNPYETLTGMALILLGWIVYFVSPKNDEGMPKSGSPSTLAVMMKRSPLFVHRPDRLPHRFGRSYAPKRPPPMTRRASSPAFRRSRARRWPNSPGGPNSSAHAKEFDTSWADIEKRQLGPIRDWMRQTLPAVPFSDTSPLLYVFSGPDFLHASTFFPNASTYVLCG